jgi:hypothetical protein
MVSISLKIQDQSSSRFSILGMNLAQGVDCGFTGVDRVGLAGRVRFNERGLGDGSVQFSYKRPISASTHLEVFEKLQYIKLTDIFVQNFFTLSPNQLSFSSKVSLPLLPSIATDKWLSWFKGSTLMLQPTVQYNTTNESFNLSLVPGNKAIILFVNQVNCYLQWPFSLSDQTSRARFNSIWGLNNTRQ